MNFRFLLLSALVACGDDGVNNLPDAPPIPDAATDAPPVVEAVSLTITGIGAAPVAGVDVFFQNPDSSLVARVVTDAAGVASATLEAGGFVTALQPFGNQPRGIAFSDLRTFAGVKPGDALKLALDSSGTGVDEVTFALPYDASAAYYQVNTTCGNEQYGTQGSGSNQGGLATLHGCGGTADVVVVTLDGNDQPINWFYQEGVAIVDQGTIDLSASTYQPMTDVTFTYANVPAGFPSVYFSGLVASPRGTLHSLYSGADLIAGAATITGQRPMVPGTATLTQSIFISEAQTQVLSQHGVMMWAPTAAAHTIDLGGVLMPQLTSIPTVDAAAHALEWTSAGGGQPDFVMAEMWGFRETPLLSWNWQIVAPHTGDTLTLPVLPTGLDQFNFLATDDVEIDQLVTGKVPGGYDAIRANLLTADGPQDLLDGPSGQIVFASLYRALKAASVPTRPAMTGWLPRAAASRNP